MRANPRILRSLLAASIAALVPALVAQTAPVRDLLATPRQRIEAADYRVSGHLVWVQTSGERINFPIAIKAHWFPGVLRVLAEIGQPPTAPRDMRENVLLEMRPNGENTIRIAEPGDTAARIVPFERWDVHVLAPGLAYEDLLEQQYFWPGQASEGKAKFGARDCEVVRSTPGPTDKTHYAEVKTWFDPSIGFPVYVEKTVKDTRAVKEFTYFGLRHDQGMWSAHQIEVKTRGQAGSTLLIIDRGSAKAKLGIADFNPAQLTRF